MRAREREIEDSEIEPVKESNRTTLILSAMETSVDGDRSVQQNS